MKRALDRWFIWIIFILLISMTVSGTVSGCIKIDLFGREARPATLYRIDLDGKNKQTMVNNEIFDFVQVIDEWIYYVRFADRKLYRIKTNGKNRQKLGDDQVTATDDLPRIVNGWIYYHYLDTSAPDKKLNGFQFAGSNIRLGRIKIDGSERQQLSADNGLDYQFAGDWLYYRNLSDLGNVYRIGLDGSGRQKLTAIEEEQTIATKEPIPPARTREIGSYVAADDWLYYYDGYYDLLLKTKTDRFSPVAVNNGLYQLAAFIDGWIYYYDSQERGLFRIQPDGSGKMLISSQAVRDAEWGLHFIINDGWIYFYGFAGEGKESGSHIYKKPLDDTAATELGDAWGMNLKIEQQYVFYIGGLDLCRINQDGTGNTTLCSNVHDYQIAAGWIYFAN